MPTATKWVVVQADQQEVTVEAATVEQDESGRARFLDGNGNLVASFAGYQSFRKA